MKVKVSSTFNREPTEIWHLLKRSSTLVYVTRGLIGFRSSAEEFPQIWQEGKTEHMQILLFGLVRAWHHQIRFVSVSEKNMQIMTHEAGGMISKWNHQMSVSPVNCHSCLYTDEIEIEAGLLTPMVWLYAQVYYRYRHIRWRYLVNTL